MNRALPRKLVELGRIRIGDQEPTAKGGKRPHKLDTFRLTSGNKSLLHYAAQLYGGEVRSWEDAPNGDQWELYTGVNSLDVLIPTASAVTVQYEVWSRGGCTLRCNGGVVIHSAQPEQVGMACLCPTNEQQRTELAKDSKACARILRLNVLLPDLPGMGCWRLETKGYYATAELLGTLDMLQGSGKGHTIIEAVLRLEQRSVKREGKTFRFNTPVLWPKYTPRELLAGMQAALIQAPAPRPALEAVKSLSDHISDLYGDRPQADPRQTPLGQAITQRLMDAGLSPEQQDAAWSAWRQKYPDLTPGVLSMLRDKVEAKYQATLAPHPPSTDETIDATLWEQEETGEKDEVPF